ncbi:unnamed protein product [Lactuca virosa]|uniref:Uncharacterized protein n=1 Tax=Lactuca virosa TaxID=75947 RepID=A0AAU9LQN8_9ASTR|nr:unnamed protein product [Lactuca virosa]
MDMVLCQGIKHCSMQEDQKLIWLWYKIHILTELPLYNGGSTEAIRAACKDFVAMLFMFDLTSRCTLNSVVNWYQEARKHNQTAIPVMVGSKFDFASRILIVSEINFLWQRGLMESNKADD